MKYYFSQLINIVICGQAKQRSTGVHPHTGILHILRLPTSALKDRFREENLPLSSLEDIITMKFKWYETEKDELYEVGYVVDAQI